MATTGLDLGWTLGDRMAKARRASGVSSYAMAAHLGVSRNTIGRWENGHTTPTKSVVIVWSQVTGAPIDWLAGDDLDGPFPTADLPIQPSPCNLQRAA
jgi:transcriptional regulator with XRE-family HTH domain